MVKDKIFNELKDAKLFEGLEESDLKKVFSVVSVDEGIYEKDEIIVSQGDALTEAGVLTHGSVACVKYHQDGKVETLRHYSKRSMLLLEGINTPDRTSPLTIVAKEDDTTVVYFPYHEIIENKEIISRVRMKIMTNCTEILSNELVRCMYKIDILAKRILQDRVLTYLSQMIEKTGEPTVDIGMTQAKLAQHLRVNRSVLSKELNVMRKKGLIDYKRSTYTIL